MVEKRDARRKGWQAVDTTVKEVKYTVTPLNEGSLYVFRVAAENAVGVGPFCELPDSVLAKDTFSEFPSFFFYTLVPKVGFCAGAKKKAFVRCVPATPGPPYALAVNAVTKRYVDLQWEAPKNDGGRPILKYVLARRSSLSLQRRPFLSFQRIFYCL